MRGRLYRKDGLLFMPLLHPAGALRRAEWMPLLEQDFRTLKELLSRPVREDEITDLVPKAAPILPDKVEATAEQNLSLF